MAQLPITAPRSQGKHRRASLAFFCVEVSVGILVCAAIVWGVYYFRCYDPCGTGAIGWQGPMVTRGYMLGTLTVQA